MAQNIIYHRMRQEVNVFSTRYAGPNTLKLEKRARDNAGKQDNFCIICLKKKDRLYPELSDDYIHYCPRRFCSDCCKIDSSWRNMAIPTLKKEHIAYKGWVARCCPLCWKRFWDLISPLLGVHDPQWKFQPAEQNRQVQAQRHQVWVGSITSMNDWRCQMLEIEDDGSLECDRKVLREMKSITDDLKNNDIHNKTPNSFEEGEKDEYRIFKPQEGFGVMLKWIATQGQNPVTQVSRLQTVQSAAYQDVINDSPATLDIPVIDRLIISNENLAAPGVVPTSQMTTQVDTLVNDHAIQARGEKNTTQNVDTAGTDNTSMVLADPATTNAGLQNRQSRDIDASDALEWSGRVTTSETSQDVAQAQSAIGAGGPQRPRRATKRSSHISVIETSNVRNATIDKSTGRGLKRSRTTGVSRAKEPNIVSTAATSNLFCHIDCTSTQTVGGSDQTLPRLPILRSNLQQRKQTTAPTVTAAAAAVSAPNTNSEVSRVPDQMSSPLTQLQPIFKHDMDPEMEAMKVKQSAYIEQVQIVTTKYEKLVSENHYRQDRIEDLQRSRNAADVKIERLESETSTLKSERNAWKQRYRSESKSLRTVLKSNQSNERKLLEQQSLLEREIYEKNQMITGTKQSLESLQERLKDEEMDRNSLYSQISALKADRSKLRAEIEDLDDRLSEERQAKETEKALKEQAEARENELRVEQNMAQSRMKQLQEGLASLGKLL